MHLSDSQSLLREYLVLQGLIVCQNKTNRKMQNCINLSNTQINANLCKTKISADIFYKAKVRQSVMNLFSKGSTRVRVYNKAPYISGYVSDDILEILEKL